MKSTLLATSCLVSALALAQPAAANPSGATVVAGQAVVSQTAQSTLVQQSTQKAVINWQNLSLAQNQSLTFAQPNAQSFTLNRVVTNSTSFIDGKVSANGNIWFINPNGILFGGNAQINVGGLLATTSDIATQDFMSGLFKFSQPSIQSGASIVNQGHITALDGGSVVLAGNSVANQGTIQANLGSVVLAGAKTFTVDFYGDNLISFAIDGGVDQAPKDANGNPVGWIVSNSGTIAAQGGQVTMSARTANKVLDHLINMSGQIQASSVSVHNGTVVLDAGDGGAIDLSGTVVAQGGSVHIGSPQAGSLAIETGAVIDAGTTGKIETSAHDVSIGKATVKAASWLIDPYDLTIDTATASTLDTALNAGGTVILQTLLAGVSTTIGGVTNAAGNGDIVVAAPIAWSNAGTLTLDAYRNISINASISHTGTPGALSLIYGDQSGTLESNSAQGNYVIGSGASVKLLAGDTLSIGNASYSLVTDTASLAAISSGNYALAQSFSAGSLSASGSLIASFGGNFAGLGNTISGLSIGSATGSAVGLFGTVTSGTVRDLNLTTVSVTGTSNVGALAGIVSSGSGAVISKVTVSGTVTAPDLSSNIGGLIGQNGGTVASSSMSGMVGESLSAGVGGLIGQNTTTGTILASSSSATVTGGGNTGGLVGTNQGYISGSFATGSVSAPFFEPTGMTAGDSIGGLVGVNRGTVDGVVGTIINSYATGAVSSNQAILVGGLAGLNEGYISGSYATGAVTLTNGNVYLATADNTFGRGGDVGGLVGWNGAPSINRTIGTIVNSYSSGAVSGPSNVGGLVGENEGAITGSSVSGTASVQLAASGSNAGGLVGVNSGGALISGVTVSASVLGGNFSSELGGVAGWNGGTIANASASGSVGGANVNSIGGLVGNNTGIVNNSSATVAVSTGVGFGDAGGLVGENFGFVLNSHASGSVQSNGEAGGLVGFNNGILDNVYATGSVTGIQAGGLVGSNDGEVNDAYATGAVSTTGTGGGLIASNWGLVYAVYATGAVSGSGQVGGLIGYNSGSVGNAYATGGVQSTFTAGGLIGQNDFNGTISNSYASGLVSGAKIGGGLAGQNQGTFLASFWSPSSTGQANGAGSGKSTGMTGALASNSGVSAGWDFSTVWTAGGSAPQLQGFTTASLATGGTQDGVAYSSGINLFGKTFALLTSAAQLTSLATLSNTQTLTGSYILDINQNLSGVSMTPIGTTATPFNGTVLGLGSASLFGLTISQSGSTSATGMFGVVGPSGLIADFELIGASITGGSNTGALVGLNQGTIWNDGVQSSTVVGSVSTGAMNVGGMVGNNQGLVSAFTTSVTVIGDTASTNVGGMVGVNSGALVNANTQFNSVGMAVSGGSNVGGQVGSNTGQITESLLWFFQPGTATIAAAGGNVGGIVGSNSGTITSSFVGNAFPFNTTATLSIVGTTNVGGMVGNNTAGGLVSNSSVSLFDGGVGNPNSAEYLQVSASVSGAGGLVGSNSGTVGTSAGNVGIQVNGFGGGTAGLTVSGPTGVGGIVGDNFGTIVGNLSIDAIASGTGANNVGITISGAQDVGGLVGHNHAGSTWAPTPVNYNLYLSAASGTAAVAITGANSIGGMIGENDASVGMSNSSANATNTGGQLVVAGTYAVGGLIGTNAAGATLSSAFANIPVSGIAAVGGAVGDNFGAISIVAVNGTSGNLVRGNSFVGGVAGVNENGASIDKATVSNLTVSGIFAVGGIVGHNSSTLTNSSIFQSTVEDAVSATSGMIGGAVGWNDVGGTVTQGTIGLVSQVTVVASNGADAIGGVAGSNWGLISGVQASSVLISAGSSVSEIGGLVGWNVAGTTTAGKVNGTILDSGFFGQISAAQQAQFVGGIAGDNWGTIATSSGTVPMVSAKVTITAGTDLVINNIGTRRIGGLVGYNIGTISGAVASSTMTFSGTSNGPVSAGGLVGFNDHSRTPATTASAGSSTTVISTFNSPSVTLSNSVGTIVNSSATTTITSSQPGAAIGGLAGVNNANIASSFATSVIAIGGTGSTEIGGLVGVNDGTVTSSKASSVITLGDSAYDIGGVAGYNDGNIQGVLASATIVTGNYAGSATVTVQTTAGSSVSTAIGGVGGLVGHNVAGGSLVSAAMYGTPSVTVGSQSINIGGAVGFNEATSTMSLIAASGTVSAGAGSSQIGGLVGSNAGTINQSFATGSVTGSGYIGGLAGLNSALIDSTYSTASVAGQSGTTYAGGLVGLNTGSINASYAIGVVSASSTTAVGAFAGGNTGGTITSGYYDANTGTQAALGGVASFQSAVGTSQSTFGNVFGASSSWRNSTATTYYPMLSGFPYVTLILANTFVTPGFTTITAVETLGATDSTGASTSGLTTNGVTLSTPLSSSAGVGTSAALLAGGIVAPAYQLNFTPATVTVTSAAVPPPPTTAAPPPPSTTVAPPPTGTTVAPPPPTTTAATPPPTTTVAPPPTTTVAPPPTTTAAPPPPTTTAAPPTTTPPPTGAAVLQAGGGGSTSTTSGAQLTSVVAASITTATPPPPPPPAPPPPSNFAPVIIANLGTPNLISSAPPPPPVAIAPTPSGGGGLSSVDGTDTGSSMFNSISSNDSAGAPPPSSTSGNSGAGGSKPAGSGSGNAPAGNTPAGTGGSNTGGQPPAGNAPPTDSSDRAMNVVAQPPPVQPVNHSQPLPPHATSSLSPGLVDHFNPTSPPPPKGTPGIVTNFSSSGNSNGW